MGFTNGRKKRNRKHSFRVGRGAQSLACGTVQAWIDGAFLAGLVTLTCWLRGKIFRQNAQEEATRCSRWRRHSNNTESESIMSEDQNQNAGDGSVSDDLLGSVNVTRNTFEPNAESCHRANQNQ